MRAARAIERELHLQAPVPRSPHLRDGDRQNVDNANRRAVRRGTPLARPADLHGRLRPALKSARSQAELFDLLAANGVEAELSGGGWKLRAEGAHEWLKATTVHRSIAWAKVEKMLAENAARSANRTRPAAAQLPEIQMPTTHEPAEVATQAPPHSRVEPTPAPPPGLQVPPALQGELRALETLDLHNVQRHALHLPMPTASSELVGRLRDLLRRLVSIFFGARQASGQPVPDESAGRKFIAAAVAEELDRRAASPRSEAAVLREVDQVGGNLAAAEGKARKAPGEAQIAASSRRQAAEAMQIDRLERNAAMAAAALQEVLQAEPANTLSARLGGAVKRHAEALRVARAGHKQAAEDLAAAKQQVPAVSADILAALQSEVVALRADLAYWRSRSARLDSELAARRAADSAAVSERPLEAEAEAEVADDAKRQQQNRLRPRLA